MKRFVCLILASVLVPMAPADPFAAGGPLAALMDARQCLATGVGKLATPEQQALLDWMREKVRQHDQQAAAVVSPALAQCRQELATAQAQVRALVQMLPVHGDIQRIAENGTSIQLDDGSRWHVMPGDELDARGWDVGDEVLVIDGNEMLHLDNAEKIEVRRVK